MTSRSRARTAAIPVIQVSATAITVSDRAHGLTQGADAYLTEPTEPEELLAVVMAALRYYRARQRAAAVGIQVDHAAHGVLGGFHEIGSDPGRDLITFAVEVP